MQYNLLILFVFYSQMCLSQVSYTSPYTLHFPSGEIESINRVINIDGETVTIKSETVDNNTDVQTFYIQEFSQQYSEDFGESDFFVCSSTDGKFITYFLIPIVEKVKFIDVVQPEQLTFNARHYRFLVD